MPSLFDLQPIFTQFHQAINEIPSAHGEDLLLKQKTILNYHQRIQDQSKAIGFGSNNAKRLRKQLIFF